MSNETDYLAGYAFSRLTESDSSREGSPLVVSHPSSPTEEKTHIMRESISKRKASGETGATPQTFQSFIVDASGICDDPTHSRSIGGPIDFLLVNPSTNDIDAQMGSAIHKLRPRARAANQDSLDGYLENELTVFQRLYQSSCSVPVVADGVNADGTNMMVVTGASCERHSRGTRPRVEPCQSLPAGDFQALRMTNTRSDRRGVGSRAPLFPDCESFTDEWTGPPMKFKLKPIHPHMDPYTTFRMFFHAVNGSMDPQQQLLTPLTPC